MSTQHHSHHHPPPPEAAIQNSPLFHLPAEVRTQIYAAILTQSPELLISRKRFIPRTEPTGLFPDRCMHCSRPCSTCICRSTTTATEFYYPDRGPLPARSISPTLLATCRLIYHEAAPLLYRENRFHFVDPTAIPLFRERADQRHASLVENLLLTIHSQRRATTYSWEDYVIPHSNTHRHLRLAEHFPHLRSAIVRLRGTFETAGEDTLSAICAGVARILPPLEWLHIDGLTDGNAAAEFRPVVMKPKISDSDAREVRTDRSQAWSREGWMNVTVWWGNAGEEPPYKPPCEPWPICLRRILQRSINVGKTYTVREEVLPCVSGIGGTQGASACL